MRKIILSAIVFILYITVSHAQLRVAIVAGGHQSTVIEENDLPDWNEIKNGYTGRTGFHGGFIADIPFSLTSKVYFQPGVIFHNKGRKFSRTFDPPAGTITRQQSSQFINYIDVPLNLVYKMGRKTKFIVGAGPYAGLFFNGKETAQTYTETGLSASEENNDPGVGKNPGQYRVLHFGANALAGVEFNRIFITVNYSRGLNDFYTAKDYDGTFKHQVIGGTLGIFLGKPVKLEKKIKDRDKDGIADDLDGCPDEAGSVITNGCPDKDADGIADKDDKCPDVPGISANKGCPVTDSDNDGVNDDVDKCPDTPGLKKYDGCPIPDRDRDGINDEEDKCPDEPGYARYGGCLVPDTDGDGINDEEDKCPAVKGSKENNGCPAEVKKEIVEKVDYAAKRIQFKVSKATLLPQSLTVLDEVATILKENPELNLLIEGHTSADGSFTSNMKLSNDRAGAVLQYLVSKGIDKNRLTAKGFGPTQPLNEGKTAEQRAENRRVVLQLSN